MLRVTVALQIAARIRDVGVVVVRNTVPEALALEWVDRVKAYLKANPDYTGFPEDNPQVRPALAACALLPLLTVPTSALVHRCMRSTGLRLK